ncbi:MAG: hypothetical protein HXY18_15920 [Bryobacteraceae bacterium]|nr:hypothetical protein [Bryobacteraceae bacterium]
MTRRDFIPLLLSAPAQRHARIVRRITAWPANGQPIDSSALTIKVEGKPARIVRTRGADAPLLLLIVSDLTGDLTLADAARQALLAEIEKLPPSAWIGLLRVQDGLQVLLDPTPDRAAAAAALNALAITGRANLLDSLEPACILASSILHKTGVRTAVLCVTDSNIYNYREDYTNPVINYSDSRDLSRRFPEALIREKTAKVASSLAELDAPVFATHLAFLRDRLNEAYQTGLQQMMQATGGEALFARAQTEIAPMIAGAVSRLNAMWAIDIEIPPDTPRSFTVELASPGLQINYRSRFAMRSRKRE